jgi:adenylate kinase family enzyme
VQKVAVVGCGGSGKSHVARRLGRFLDVLRYVLGYRRTMRPRVTAKIDQYAADAKVITLTSRWQVRLFLSLVADHS